MQTQPPASPLLPDANGFFGEFGGRYVPEVLIPNLEELAKAFDAARADPSFWAAYARELREFSGRPTPITPLPRLSKRLGGANLWLKREDLSQTGAHKVNNVIGQGLLVQRLGKRRVIAETGAGQHGVATATMAARFGLEATIYMGAEDVERQRPNVFWMERMGARVVSVDNGSRTLKDAINEAMRDWSANLETTHYVLGTACGPHPFPALVSWLQSIVGAEAAVQFPELTGRAPDRVYACVGGGSNALGIWQGFLASPSVEIIGAEAGGRGPGAGEHASRCGAALASGDASVGIAQGYRTIFLQNGEGQMQDTHSVAAGLDYVGISPIIADLAQRRRVRMAAATDAEVLDAVAALMAEEGIISALESAHGLAVAMREARSAPRTANFLINLSGRGDKDIFTIAEAFGDKSWGHYLRRRADTLTMRDDSAGRGGVQ